MVWGLHGHSPDEEHMTVMGMVTGRAVVLVLCQKPITDLVVPSSG